MGGEGEGRGVVAASTLRLYCKVHPIIYSCPSRTIIQLHTSAQLVIVFSACLSACLLVCSLALTTGVLHGRSARMLSILSKDTGYVHMYCTDCALPDWSEMPQGSPKVRSPSASLQRSA